MRRDICTIAIAAVMGVSAWTLNAEESAAEIEVSQSQLEEILSEAAPGGELASGTDQEILHHLLKTLGVPIESQVLVFSKTSAQNPLISPQRPRAIYFSENYYVGWAQGGEIEVASFDPEEGMLFHLVKMKSREPNLPPVAVRESSCLNCHESSRGEYVPELRVRSVHTDEEGNPIFQVGTFRTRHDSPIDERWGGWYVTGSVDESTHMGNRFSELAENEEDLSFHELSESSLNDLSEWIRAEPYLNKGQSDVVALMMLEHQVGVHNTLVEANLRTRDILRRYAGVQKSFGNSVDAPLSETYVRIIGNIADEILEKLLFAEEFQLPEGVNGNAAFRDAFRENRIKSSSGRSLKDFRLYERLMKYRCSYLIYSEAFEHLPEVLRTMVLERLYAILVGTRGDTRFSYLKDSEREAILEIVAETVPRLPPVWEKVGAK